MKQLVNKWITDNIVHCLQIIFAKHMLISLHGFYNIQCISKTISMYFYLILMVKCNIVVLVRSNYILCMSSTKTFSKNCWSHFFSLLRTTYFKMIIFSLALWVMLMSHLIHVQGHECRSNFWIKINEVIVNTKWMTLLSVRFP